MSTGRKLGRDREEGWAQSEAQVVHPHSLRRPRRGRLGSQSQGKRWMEKGREVGRREEKELGMEGGDAEAEGWKVRKAKYSQVPVAHACNPSYSEVEGSQFEACPGK
jgi:hypothetical protein